MPLLIISFIAGVLTVLAPCVLPLLPIIVGGSLSGAGVSKKRAVVVTLSLGVSIILFTLLLKVSSIFINVPQTAWEIISGVIILIFGLATLFPAVWDRLPIINKLNRSSNKMLASGYQKKNIWGDMVIGASLGPVFSSCSPTYFIILATVLPRSFGEGILDLLVYALGLCLSLLIIGLLGQRLLQAVGIAADPNGWFKRGLGIVFIIVGITIVTGYDQIIEANLLTNGFFDITGVEQKLLSTRDTTLPSLTAGSSTPLSATSSLAAGLSATSSKDRTTLMTIAAKAMHYRLAPELAKADTYLNTNGQPITLAQFKGQKVVLIDFWTYSCINCIRTLPYVKAWYDKYHDQGLEIISIHTPEFSFEKVPANVADAVKKDGIKYPVLLDNEYQTWNTFGNMYWPRKYLIDIDGYIVYDHIGEGNYAETEQAIQAALKERDTRLGETAAMPPTGQVTAPAFDPNQVQSPETYFGSDRNEYLANGTGGMSGTQTLSIPAAIEPNQLYLGGTWLFSPENAETKSAASITFKYQAKNVYMVASAPGGIDVTIKRDGQVMGTKHIDAEQLYPLIEGTDYGTHTLEVSIPNAGLKAFTFTFG